MLMNAQWGRIYREGAGEGQLVSFGVERLQLLTEGEVQRFWEKKSRESWGSEGGTGDPGEKIY